MEGGNFSGSLRDEPSSPELAAHLSATAAALRDGELAGGQMTGL
jgi:hypothetical protein